MKTKQISPHVTLEKLEFGDCFIGAENDEDIYMKINYPFKDNEKFVAVNLETGQVVFFSSQNVIKLSGEFTYMEC